ncbi:MAG: dihydroxyacetone kinase, partial [Eubacterium sp.]
MSDYILDKTYFTNVIKDLIQLAEDRKDYFTELDSAIGDGDHGMNLSIGFREVNKHLDEWQNENINNFYKSSNSVSNMCFM